jgi:hypothetical protein
MPFIQRVVEVILRSSMGLKIKIKIKRRKKSPLKISIYNYYIWEILENIQERSLNVVSAGKLTSKDAGLFMRNLIICVSIVRSSR